LVVVVNFIVAVIFFLACVFLSVVFFFIIREFKRTIDDLHCTVGGRPIRLTAKTLVHSLCSHGECLPAVPVELLLVHSCLSLCVELKVSIDLCPVSVLKAQL
jgi:hypothetical protein